MRTATLTRKVKECSKSSGEKRQLEEPLEKNTFQIEFSGQYGLKVYHKRGKV